MVLSPNSCFLRFESVVGGDAVADEAHVKILRGESVDSWNRWRVKNPGLRPDLSAADLRGRELRGVNLRQADLRQADFSEAADVRGANLGGSSYMLDIGTDLFGSDLREADLREADLREADLREANLRGAKLEGANLRNAIMNSTELGELDLSRVEGLETVRHHGPSTVGIDTIYRSKGDIPERFLREAGVPEPFIVHMKSLVAAMSPIEFYSCFISYSSRDQEFAERLYADLQNKGVRCWFAPEDLKIGDKLRPAFDEAIRVHDKLMAVLSENSVGSPWVEKEVETAFEKERRQSRTVLFPIRLDEAVMETDQAWAADIRRTRHIGDFRDWKNHDSYKKAFDRLLRDLKAV
jgi:uncharacterized protein YjbI with pentapeptide repeats